MELISEELVETEVVEETALVVESHESAVSFLDDGNIDLVEKFEDDLDAQGLNEVPGLNDSCLIAKITNGMYARALKMPANMIITGALHKKNYIDIFISGDVTVKSYFANGEVEESERINSFRFFEGKAGRKRVLYTHKETLWVTVDPSTAENLEEALDNISCRQTGDYLKYQRSLE